MRTFNFLKKRKPKVGLALGSGGAKGYAHLGVIKVLEENKIPIDFIVGSSAGAIIGSLYALNPKIEEIKKIINSRGWSKSISLLDLSWKQGLMKGEKFKNFLEEVTKNSSFKDTKIPLSVMATDFNNAESVRINEGNIALAIRGSASVPLFFKPVSWKEHLLCDGGLSEPVPVEAVKKMGAEIVIAVNLDNSSYFKNKEKTTNFWDNLLLTRYFHCLQYHLAQKSLRNADIIIEPQVGYLGSIGWQKLIKGEIEDVVQEGERSTQEALSQIKKILKIN
ncbi:patatin-like phospholipase family protein [Patescibacteria group bacterium]|nr:patatin-like phospholipase family protein [Patescibacteria group bacterium]